MAQTGVNLSGMNLSGMNLSDVNLTDADLTGADLTGVIGANLTGAIINQNVPQAVAPQAVAPQGNADQNIAAINQVFTKSIFNINPFGTTISIKTKDNVLCLSLYFYKDYIYITSLNKCGITGSNSLKKVEEVAKLLLKSIKLMDASTINKCGVELDLAIIKILTNGQSWYNSLGYYSDNYKDEIAHNKNILDLSCKDFFESVFEKCFKKFLVSNSKDTINNKIKMHGKREALKKKIETEQKKLDDYDNFIRDETEKYILRRDAIIQKGVELYPYPNTGMNVKDYFTHIWSDDCTPDKSKWLSDIIEYIDESKILKYDNQLKKLFIDAKGKRKKTKRRKLLKLKRKYSGTHRR